MRSLFLFTIGPVKSFIENSRKGIDLYAGSSMLSELMREAVSWLGKREEVMILFPFHQMSGEALPNIPNRLVAEFADGSRMEQKAAAEQLTAYVKTCFRQRCSGLLETAGISDQGIGQARKQWEDFLEIYWIFEEYHPASHYSEVYQKMLAGLHEAKSIRTFSQSTEPWGRKCMRFPEYNAVFVKRSRDRRSNTMAYPHHTNPQYMYDITENDYLKYTVKEKEALSSIALVKRIYGMQRKDIYSIRNMLLESQIPGDLLSGSGLQDLGSEMRTMIANAVYDLENDNALPADEYRPEAVEMAGLLYQRMKENGIRLNSYYAVIKFDGDNMGEAFMLLKTVQEQQELSRRISRFACEAPGLIVRYGGLPVFAGGEDFLGILPLGSLFGCIGELRKTFCEIIERSFSVGISIAHLMQPLREVLYYADAMETQAKELPGKDAFAISIIKRSGETIIMPALSLPARAEQPHLNDVAGVVEMMKDEEFSRSMFFCISEQMKCFRQEEAKPDEALAKILLKCCIDHSAGDGKQISKEHLLEQLMRFYKHSQSVTEFLHIVDGIVFLSREVV